MSSNQSSVTQSGRWAFEDAARVATLRREAGEWIGTPFRHRQRVKGAGVDCVHLVAELLKACGIDDHYEFPAYALDYAQHWDRSLIAEWIESSGLFEVATTPPMAGDIVGFIIGRCVHHAGVMLDGKTFVHSLHGHAVKVSSLEDATWKNRAEIFWRAMAK